MVPHVSHLRFPWLKLNPHLHLHPPSRCLPPRPFSRSSLYSHRPAACPPSDHPLHFSPGIHSWCKSSCSGLIVCLSACRNRLSSPSISISALAGIWPLPAASLSASSFRMCAANSGRVTTPPPCSCVEAAGSCSCTTLLQAFSACCCHSACASHCTLPPASCPATVILHGTSLGCHGVVVGGPICVSHGSSLVCHNHLPRFPACLSGIGVVVSGGGAPHLSPAHLAACQLLCSSFFLA